MAPRLNQSSSQRRPKSSIPTSRTGCSRACTKPERRISGWNQIDLFNVGPNRAKRASKNQGVQPYFLDDRSARPRHRAEEEGVREAHLSIALHGLSLELRDASMIIYRSDDVITDDEDRELRNLLFSCFSFNPIFLARRYFIRRPEHRWLVKTPAGQIVAHAALHEKTIGTESGDLLIGGVAEVCVATKHRGLGIAKELLQSIDQWLSARDVPFAMLFGQPKIYASSGYVPMQNELRTDNLLSGHWNPFCGTPMIKALSPIPWPRGIIDLRGSTF